MAGKGFPLLPDDPRTAALLPPTRGSPFNPSLLKSFKPS